MLQIEQQLNLWGGIRGIKTERYIKMPIKKMNTSLNPNRAAARFGGGHTRNKKLNDNIKMPINKDEHIP